MTERIEESPRPFWQHGPCTSWCVDKHRELDYGSDRRCMSKARDVTFSLHNPRRHEADGQVFHEVPCAQAYVIHRAFEAGPRVVVELEAEQGITPLHMTATEAREMVDALTFALELAGGESR